MASDFDDLVKELQYGLALAADEGLSYSELAQQVHSFYTVKNAPIQAATTTFSTKDLLFSEEPPETVTIVTSHFVELAWEWLSKLKDVKTRVNETDHVDGPHPGERLVSSIEQLWLAVAGHGIDNSRVKGAEFTLLHIIAKHGAGGLTQPELVRTSGQDKRSVPSRTDNLAKRSYITKVPIISQGAKTSLLKLSKFAQDASLPKANAQPNNDKLIFYDQWFDDMIRLLRANNGIMAVDDLRTELSIPSRNWQVKALQRCVRRLESAHCIRRIRAKVAGRTKGDRGLFARCVQLLREPTDSDRALFMAKGVEHTTLAKDNITIKQPNKEAAVVDDEDDEDDDDDIEVDETIDLTKATLRIVPQWYPDVPLTNFIFDMIEHAGVAGIAIMELHKRGVGPVWRRPMDEELIRLCDRWQTSQPAHLKHLTIMKDTGATDKFTYFKYRTIANFEQAVRNGDAFWEAVTYKSNQKSSANGTLMSAAKLDAYGFPPLDRNLFAGSQTGTATLEQCVRSIDKKSRTAREQDEFWTQGAAREPAHEVEQPVRGEEFAGQARFGPLLLKRKAIEVESSVTPRPYKERRVSRYTLSAPELDTLPSDDIVQPILAEGVDLLVQPQRDVAQSDTARHLRNPETMDELPSSTALKPIASAPHIVAGASQTLPQSKPTKPRFRQTPMVSINTPRAIRMRNKAVPHQGRRHRNLVVVIKSARLLTLPWYSASDVETSNVSGSHRAMTDAISRGTDGRMIETMPTREPPIEATQSQAGGEDYPVHPMDDLTSTGARAGQPSETVAYAANEHGNGLASHESQIDNARTGVVTALAPVADTAITQSLHNSPLAKTHDTKSKERHTLSLPTFESIDDDAPRPTKKSSGMSRASGTVQVKRTQVIMEVLRKCNGLYPGNKEIYQPVAVALKRMHGTVADTSTIDNSVKSLLARGKLRKMVFTFHDETGFQVQRSIITDPSIAPGDPRVAAMQQRIVDAHPHKYHPAEVEIPEEMRASLDAKIANKRWREPDHVEVEGPAVNTGANADNFPLDDAVVVQRVGPRFEEIERQLQATRAARAVRDTARAAKRAKLTRHESMRDSDDEDVSDPETEQLERMSEFQANDYAHNRGHAFISRKRGTRFATRNTTEAFFSTMKRDRIKHTTEQDKNAPETVRGQAYRSNEALSKVMSRRSMLLMFNSETLVHEISGTFGTTAVLRNAGSPDDDHMPASTAAYDMYNNSFSAFGRPLPVLAPAIGRNRPFTRLQSLGSSLMNYDKYRNSALLSKHVDLSTEVVHLDPALVPKRKHDTVDSIADEPVKKKPKPYKSMRGSKKALGVDESAHATTEPSVGMIEHETFVGGPGFAVNKKRDRKGPQMFQDNDRLASAVALYRVILGGMDQRNNWGVIAHMLSFRYEADFLRRRWDAVKNSKESAVRSTMERIYEPFLRAYESGELPAVDFANLNDVDWPSILAWFEKEVSVPSGPQGAVLPELPRSLLKFQGAFSVTEPPSFWEQAKEAWFTSQIEKMRKDLAHEFVYGCPLPGHHRPTSAFYDDRLVLKTWIRAIAATRADVYDSGLAAAKLSVYTDANIAAACEELVASKTLRHMNKGRQQPGRNFEIHDSHWAFFRRWPGKLVEWKYVRDLAKARQTILRRFQVADRVNMDFHADDAEVAVLMNMTDQGLIRVFSELPARNDDFEAPFPKISAFGYSGYSYNAKTLDREKLRFPIVYERTDNFTVEHGLVGGIPIPATPHPMYDDGRLPFWVDIHGNLLPDIWDLVLRSVLHLVVFRSGCPTRLMEESHGRKLLAWEIDLVVEWMERSGIAVRCGAGKETDGVWQGGWRASEWWYCAFEHEMTFWKAA